MHGEVEMNQKSEPGHLLGISGAYWETCTLHAAVKLDIFSIIGDKVLDAEGVAQCINADTRATAMFLNALCAMKVMRKEGETYRNTEDARTFLCKESPRYVGYMIMHHHHLMEPWMRLDEAVISGESVYPLMIQHDEDSRRESFLMGMFNLAMGIAPELVPTLDLSGKTRLLDLGGGPGTYAIHFCMHNPQLAGTVFDLATTQPFAEQTIVKFDLSDRVKFSPGDFHTDDLGGPYDVAWLSHILHGESPEAGRKIVAKAADTLEPGGMMIIHEFILDNTKDGPLFPALFSLNMLAVTDSGQSYSEHEIREMMEAAGIGEIHRTAYRGPTESSVLVGIKK
jgi:SAM-dependent methyltransferase